ncbi:MAG TPA: hypothetical protein DCQ64_23810 [Candidatus Rokubacteria bacterium]|nr:hypothetical protein [Candidatus Rokubacteria bacterium]
MQEVQAGPVEPKADEPKVEWDDVHARRAAELRRARQLIDSTVVNRLSGKRRVVTDVRYDVDRRRTRKLAKQGMGGPGHEIDRLVVELDGRFVVNASQLKRNWDLVIAADG